MSSSDGGPLGGLYSALLMATTPIVVVLAGDMPFVEPRLLRALAAIDPMDDAVVPRTATAGIRCVRRTAGAWRRRSRRGWTAARFA